MGLCCIVVCVIACLNEMARTSGLEKEEGTTEFGWRERRHEGGHDVFGCDSRVDVHNHPQLLQDEMQHFAAFIVHTAAVDNTVDRYVMSMIRWMTGGGGE